jgi:hypothetical protein
MVLEDTDLSEEVKNTPVQDLSDEEFRKVINEVAGDISLVGWIEALADQGERSFKEIFFFLFHENIDDSENYCSKCGQEL